MTGFRVQYWEILGCRNRKPPELSPEISPLPPRLRLALLPGRQSGSEQRGAQRASAAGHALTAVFTGRAFPRITHSALSSAVHQTGCVSTGFYTVILFC